MSPAIDHNFSSEVESQLAAPTEVGPPGSPAHVRSVLVATAEPACDVLSASIELREFRRAETYLTLSDHRFLVEQAITLPRQP